MNNKTIFIRIILFITLATFLIDCSNDKKQSKENIRSNEGFNNSKEIAQRKKTKLFIDEKSAEFYKYLYAVITYDSAKIYVERKDELLNQHQVPDGFYITNVEYDRMTGFISFNQCKKLPKIGNYWQYQLKVWDYKTGKEWALLHGETYDGEGLFIPTVYKFNEIDSSGILFNYGYESYGPSLLKSENSRGYGGLDKDYVDLFAIINSDELLISTHDSGEETTSYYKYSIVNDKLFEIDLEDLYNYKDLILSQFGRNLTFYRIPFNDRHIYFMSNWNTYETAFIYYEDNDSLPKYDFYFYDVANNKNFQIKTDKIGLIPIWK